MKALTIFVVVLATIVLMQGYFLIDTRDRLIIVLYKVIETRDYISKNCGWEIFPQSETFNTQDH